jgi:large subunit ribosomal protein L4
MNMPVVDVVNRENKKVKAVDLKDKVFQAPVKESYFYEIVKMQLANRRLGTASTKTRGMVRGGGSKPWRQKGTGRARFGSRRTPVWKGGGVVFGPQPRDYSYKVPRGLKKNALRAALSLKLNNGELKIVDDLKLEEVKTKSLVTTLKGIEALNSLILVKERDRNLELSARNIQGVKVLDVNRLNVFDILRYKNLVMTEPVLESIQGVLG